MSKANEIATYYDQTTATYLKIYGDVIQAFRPSSDKKLLNYLKNSIGLKRGQKILDAGCGVGGPAIFFAKKVNVTIEGVTVSPVQAEIATDRIRSKGLSSRVRIHKGDFHHLTQTFINADFDGAIFLESLGHAEDSVKVIEETAQLIKPGGFIYIKDFFKKESRDKIFQNKVDTVIGRMNENYCYNTLRLIPVIETLRLFDFEIEFIKKFDFNDDTSIRAAFEEDQNIEIFKGYEEFWPAEWLEIKCIKSK
ncbi:MAG: methyltransferase domain-containing protein [Chitinophagales bacterium]